MEIPFESLLQGKIQTTYGTDFDCIAQSILERGFDKAVILTDGWAMMKEDLKAQLKAKKVSTLTILFGDAEKCEDFACFGDVVELAEVVS